MGHKTGSWPPAAKDNLKPDLVLQIWKEKTTNAQPGSDPPAEAAITAHTDSPVAPPVSLPNPSTSGPAPVSEIPVVIPLATHSEDLKLLGWVSDDSHSQSSNIEDIIHGHSDTEVYIPSQPSPDPPALSDLRSKYQADSTLIARRITHSLLLKWMRY